MWDRRGEQPGKDEVLWHAAIGNAGKGDFGEEGALGKTQSMGHWLNKGDLSSNSARWWGMAHFTSPREQFQNVCFPTGNDGSHSLPSGWVAETSELPSPTCPSQHAGWLPSCLDAKFNLLLRAGSKKPGVAAPAQPSNLPWGQKGDKGQCRGSHRPGTIVLLPFFL